jgi:hypothetical protein
MWVRGESYTNRLDRNRDASGLQETAVRLLSKSGLLARLANDRRKWIRQHCASASQNRTLDCQW